MREVWRIAYALLHDAFDGDPPIDSVPLFRHVEAPWIRVVSQMIERSLNSPQARGVGRYFDGFGALGLGRAHATYEGQAAIAWDQVADESVRDAYPFELDQSATPMEIDLRGAVRAAHQDLLQGAAASTISARFHNCLSEATGGVLEALLADLGDIPVALTGGVFQNARLAAGVQYHLRNKNRVLRHGQVPPGDGGIALGQALIADAILGDKG